MDMFWAIVAVLVVIAVIHHDYRRIHPNKYDRLANERRAKLPLGSGNKQLTDRR